MNKRRLNDLVKVLQGVARSKRKQRHFNMRSWFRVDGEGSVAKLPLARLTTECGTSACACGWYAATYPRRMPTVWWDDIAAHFGICMDDAEFLFSDDQYAGDPSVRDVLNRVKTFIKEPAHV